MAERFDGETYVAQFDEVRLGDQLRLVYRYMAGGVWRTLDEIAADLDIPQASASARLRDLRKAKNGGLTVERRHRGAATNGHYEYRIRLPNGFFPEKTSQQLPAPRVAPAGNVAQLPAAAVSGPVGIAAPAMVEVPGDQDMNLFFAWLRSVYKTEREAGRLTDETAPPILRVCKWLATFEKKG